MFSPGCFADDPAVSPAQSAEVHRQRNSGQARGSRGTASFANGNMVIEEEGQRLHRLAFGLQDFTISRQDEMVLDPPANCRVRPVCDDGKFMGGLSLDFQR